MSPTVGAPIIRYGADGAGLVLALLVVWAPVPFASVEPWSEALLRLGVATALLLVAPALRSTRRLRPVAVPAASLLALGLYGLLQSLSWPAWLAGWISPRHRELSAAAADILGGAPGGVPLSIAPAVSRQAALAFAVPAAALVVGALVSRRRYRRHWLLAGLVAAAVFQLLYGFRHWLAGSREIWGVEVPIFGQRVQGTYVNANHLAYLLEAALAATFAWTWWGLRRARREVAPERRLLLVVPPAVFWLGCFVGLAFTRSRAGLLAAVAGVAVQGLLLALPRRRWRLATVGLAAAAVGLAAVAWLGLQQGLGRLLATSVYDVAWNARLEVGRLCLKLWSQFPWTGTGLGTFRDAFTAVETADLWTGTWIHAHDDLVELLATTGLVGVLLAAVGLAALVLRLLRVLVRGRRSEDRAAALAALGALAAIAVHELFDFGLTLPANALVLAVLCGSAAGSPLDGGQARQGQAAAHHHLDRDQVEPGRRRHRHP